MFLKLYFFTLKEKNLQFFVVSNFKIILLYTYYKTAENNWSNLQLKSDKFEQLALFN